MREQRAPAIRRKSARRSSEAGLEGSADLERDEAGAYQTEYTIVLVLVAIVASLAIGSLAVPLIRYHLSITEAITAPVP